MEQLFPFNPGMAVGGAILENEIGFGGQARVFQAAYMGRPVAVKVMLTAGTPNLAKKTLARFEREQDILLLLRHSNIVSVYAAGMAKVLIRGKVTPIPYLIMELMSGPAGSHSGEPMQWREVVDIGIDAARGLEFAHSRGIVHRDIKPSNILLLENGAAKISDFGLARLLESSGTDSGGLTPFYASPEQHDPKLIAPDDLPARWPDELSDIYSLGMTFYEMLTGDLPYERSREGVFLYINGLLSPLPIDVPAPTPFTELVLKMISLRRLERPKTVVEVLKVLENLQPDRRPDHGLAPTPKEEDIFAEERAVERYARAFLRPSLVERVSFLKGQDLGGWKAISIYAIGGEGILLRVAKSGQTGLLKMPNLPYDRSAEFGTGEIKRAREELTLEADMLQKFSNTLLPGLLELAEGSNLLLSDRSPEVAGAEKYLVMEFIPGRPLDLELQVRLQLPETGGIADWLREWMQQILYFLSQIKAQDPGYFYTDFKPANVRISPDNQVHLLDAGSITWPGSARGVSVTAGYYPPGLLRPVKTSSDLEAISLVALGRTVYSSLLNRVLHEGTSFDFQALKPLCGARWAGWIEKACSGGFPNLAKALGELPKNNYFIT